MCRWVRAKWLVVGGSVSRLAVVLKETPNLFSHSDNVNVPCISKSFHMYFEFLFLFLFRWFRYRSIYWTAIDNITKCKLLTNHFKPNHNYKFPSRFQHGCMRALTYHWLTSFPFLVYSKRWFCVLSTMHLIWQIRNFSKK